MAGIAGRGTALGGALLAAFALGAPAAAATAMAKAAAGPARSREAAFAGSGGMAGAGQPGRPDLVEAARRQRERVAESRERRGPAPRFTDADLPGSDRNRRDSDRSDGNWPDGNRPDGNRPDGNRPDESRPEESRTDADRTGPDGRGVPARPGAGDAEETASGDARNSGGEAETGSGEPVGADAAAAEEALSPEEREERAAELREKLLDLEAALAALGVSGLPAATRHPNRFVSAFDAGRLRAEQREARRELAELESGTSTRPR